MDSRESASDLRAWAKGAYSSEAAIELLLRSFGGRFAGKGQPWVHDDEDGAWVDFNAILASLGSGIPVDLSEAISSLDAQTSRSCSQPSPTPRGPMSTPSTFPPRARTAPASSIPPAPGSTS